MDARSQTEHAREVAEDAMEELRETGEEIEGRLGALWEASRERVAACTQATDRAIRKNPYQAVGIALGVGVIVGMLLTRDRGSRED